MTYAVGESSIISMAQIYCKAAHDAVGQLRKYTGEHYWVHCYNVANIVADAGLSYVAVASAYLHDVVEDTKITEAILRDIFGQEITDNVMCLTEYYTKERFPNMNRAARKQKEAERFRYFSSDVHTIKVADLIDNTSTITKYDPKFAKTYLQEKENLLNYLNKADEKLLQRAKDIVEDGKKRLEL